MAGAQEEEMGEAGGSGAPLETTMEQRLQQAHDQITQMCTEYLQLQQELADARKQKEIDRGRRLPPGLQQDCFLLL